MAFPGIFVYGNFEWGAFERGKVLSSFGDVVYFDIYLIILIFSSCWSPIKLSLPIFVLSLSHLACLFQERVVIPSCCVCFVLVEKDPAESWYQGELGKCLLQ